MSIIPRVTSVLLFSPPKKTSGEKITLLYVDESTPERNDLCPKLYVMQIEKFLCNDFLLSDWSW